MSENKYSLEKLFQIYNNNSGDCIEVGPDGDGLDLIEIRIRDDGKVRQSISFTFEQAPLILKAITELVQDKNEEE